MYNKTHVANDILKVARMYNNVLYKKNYFAYGIYSEEEVKQYFGSFEEACRELKIVNPEDPYDLDAVIEDIQVVLQQEKKISPQIYKDYGIYTVNELQRRYGSLDRLILIATGALDRILAKITGVLMTVISIIPSLIFK